jgi:hypothetical protein
MDIMLAIVMEQQIVPSKEKLTFEEQMELTKFSIFKVSNIELDEKEQERFDSLMMKKFAFDLYNKKQVAFN